MKSESQEFITLQEAAKLSQKSEQTIRRGVKAKKILARKTKTPQGFVYLVDKASIIKTHSIKIADTKEKKRVSPSQPISRLTSQKKPEIETANNDHLTIMEFQKLLRNIVEEHQRERERSTRFLRELQDKVMFLEHQVIQLQAPRKRKWFQFWK